MSVPVIVSDLECLSDVSLYCIKPGNIRRPAYYAGLIGGLNIAHEYCWANVSSPNPKLWSLLAGIEYPVLPLMEFIRRIKDYVRPYSFNLETSWFPESGLRLGEPGVYYAKGIADAVKVGINQVPVHYEYLYEHADEQKVHIFTWIDEKLALANVKLEVEKSNALKKK